MRRDASTCEEKSDNLHSLIHVLQLGSTFDVVHVVLCLKSQQGDWIDNGYSKSQSSWGANKSRVIQPTGRYMPRLPAGLTAYAKHGVSERLEGVPGHVFLEWVFGEWRGNLTCSTLLKIYSFLTQKLNASSQSGSELWSQVVFPQPLKCIQNMSWCFAA